jgi:periplasmic protein TonB
MILDRRLVICAIASVAGHLAFARGLDYLPARDEAARPPRTIAVRVVEPPRPEPEPEPVKPPEPEPPRPEPPRVHERPRPQPPAAAKRDTPPVETPPVEAPATTSETTTTPTFGVTMESTSQAASAPAVPVGNTTRTQPTAPGPAKPLAEPTAAAEVTRMPLPRGDCSGKYTDEALAAGVEGVVVLDLIVDERGRARDIAVVQRLSHGLTEAAIAALTACAFSPGEKAGAPVAVRVRGFKVRFQLPDSQ